MECINSSIKITLIQVQFQPFFRVFIKFNNKKVHPNRSKHFLPITEWKNRVMDTLIVRTPQRPISFISFIKFAVIAKEYKDKLSLILQHLDLF